MSSNLAGYMNIMDDLYNDLRHKLIIFGYEQTLPVTAVPLVAAVVEDLTKTTESLRDAKTQIHDLLEEKACWELGVEPFKCDNARLLTECNNLQMAIVKERESFEERMFEVKKTIRDLETDKESLLEHRRELETQLKQKQQEKTAGDTKPNVSVFNFRKRARKPFISTVRSGDSLPALAPLAENNNVRCVKCNASANQSPCGEKGCVTPTAAHTWLHAEVEKLEANVTELTEQIHFTKRKVEAREREIDRLNGMLIGGRPLVALARDCCYKEMRMLAEDIKQLQEEKASGASRLAEYHSKMHEAMQRSLKLETENLKIRNQFDKLQAAALEVEQQANKEVAKRDAELEELKAKLQLLHKQLEDMPNNGTAANDESGVLDADDDRDDNDDEGDRRRAMNTGMNELKRREMEHLAQIALLEKRLKKFVTKINELKKEKYDAAACKKEGYVDEDKLLLQSELEFFQKEYLRLSNKKDLGNELEYLKSVLKSKDEEIIGYRKEIMKRNLLSAASGGVGSGDVVPSVSTDRNSDGARGHCVRAVVQRAERDRDCALSELERMRSERDVLLDKHLLITKAQHEASQATTQRFVELNDRIKTLEEENRKLADISRSSETHIVLLKEEIDVLKQRYDLLKDEHAKLRTAHNQLLSLHEQTERSLTLQLSRLTTSERQLESASARSAECNKCDIDVEQLQREVEALKRTYKELEHEKDILLHQLDEKSQRASDLKRSLDECEEKRFTCDRRVKSLEEELNAMNRQTQKYDNNLHQSCSESNMLRAQLEALQKSRDNAIAENARLSNELAESMSEILNLKKRVLDSESEIERLKQQLHQYVQEVKKAEDLLMFKEKERDEMLDHYRSLSHDAVMLEGNNLSLENEAAEYKRQIDELEAEIEQLKNEVKQRKEQVVILENKIHVLEEHVGCQERLIEQAVDDERLLKVDLAARKELCDKLDNECDKLNAELAELNGIRQKLEKENEQLRNDMENKYADQVTIQTLEELLSKTRRELEDQIRIDGKLSQELVRLREKNDELLRELETERKSCQEKESAAYEYLVQNQELRHNMTDDRFRQARTREQSPRFPTKPE